ncbi:MAG: CRISPR-associated endonuclease Cas1 [Nitrosomonas sp.]|nr:MAG: CRISPR-associated endonuclease Cas1 [Nitrosomonas sp.]
MRPLYIDGTANCRVVLDVPALRVTMPDQADQLFPLSRISRVVCQGSVDWSMQALLACADAGIQLLFLEKSGAIRARWLGQSGERQRLTQRLIDLLSRTDGSALYANWLLSMEKLAARSFARRMGLTDWRECSAVKLRRQLRHTLGHDDWHRTTLIQNILYSELLVWLPACGFERDNEILLSMELDLAADLSQLLLWDYYIALLDPNMAKCGENSLQIMAQLFQQRQERCYKLFRSSINKLHQFLLAVS